MLIHSSSFRTKHTFGSNITPLEGALPMNKYPNIEMHVGAWYVDECGNKTREIKARE